MLNAKNAVVAVAETKVVARKEKAAAEKANTKCNFNAKTTKDRSPIATYLFYNTHLFIYQHFNFHNTFHYKILKAPQSREQNQDRLLQLLIFSVNLQVSARLLKQLPQYLYR